ncbi:uncharacterized protein EDB91DRAFT_1012951, partial [Suillus paluster]|uniref:uncharacterized protein n=1 Tax=Suillus paluster TaxID=48578 RepID=UPI001B8665DE
MSPVTAMDSALPSTNSPMFNVPKLAEDASNWITYKERMLTAIGARGMMRYVDGHETKHTPFKIDPTTSIVTKPDGSAAMQTEISDLEKATDEFFQKDSLVRQQIFSTITNRLLLCVQ